MISLALQGSCRTAKNVAGTSVAITDNMKKRTIRSITFLSVLVFVFPLTVASQETQTISRTSLARMDVLSRARLFEPTIEKAARSEGVDPLILWTIAYNETRFRPWLTSPKNAQGLMQFMPATAARFGLANPYEPSSSLLAAAKYVKYLGRLFDGKLESVLAAYNAGEGTVSAYLHGRELRVNGRVINASRRRWSTVSRRTKRLLDMLRKVWRFIVGFSGKDGWACPQIHSDPNKTLEKKGWQK